MPRIAVAWKVGDKLCAPNKEAHTQLDGHPVGWINERHYRRPLENIISKRATDIFLWTIHDASKINIIKDWHRPLPKKYAAFRLDLSKLPIPLRQAVRRPGHSTGLVNFDKLPSNIIRQTDNLPIRTGNVDRNAVSAGTYKVGTGETYPLWSTAIADRANCTADLTFIQTTPTTENAQSLSTENLNGHTVTYKSYPPAFGNFSAAQNRIDHNFNNSLFQIEDEGPGTLNIQDLYIYASSATIFPPVAAIYADNIAAAFNLYIRRNILHGNSNNKDYAILIQENTPIAYIIANLITEYKTSGIFTHTINASSLLEFNAIQNSGIGIDANGFNPTVHSNLCLNNTLDFANIANATGRNNGSQDATAADGNWNTGSSNQPNLTPADEVRSTTPADGALFMLPILNANVYSGGRAAAAFNTRLGTRFIAHTPFPIGAKQIYPPFNNSSISQPGVNA